MLERSFISLTIGGIVKIKGLSCLLGFRLHHSLRTLTHTCSLSTAPRPLTLMTQMRRCLFFQIAMSLMKRKTVTPFMIQLIMHLPLVGHLVMKGPQILKHQPFKHLTALMVTLVSPKCPGYNSQG